MNVLKSAFVTGLFVNDPRSGPRNNEIRNSDEMHVIEKILEVESALENSFDDGNRRRKRKGED